MLSEIFKIIILVSILYVWVVRYQNIINEFNLYNLPSWFRDLIGILKISFGIMLFSNNHKIVSKLGDYCIDSFHKKRIGTNG